MMIDSGSAKTGKMVEQKNRLLLETIRRLHRRKATRSLQKVLAKAYPIDIALVLASIPDHEITDIFNTIAEMEIRAEVLTRLDVRSRDQVLSETQEDEMTAILEAMPPDDLTDMLGQLDQELAAKLLNGLERESKQEVEELLQYAPDTAGGIMTPDVFSLHSNIRASDAIVAIHDLQDVETVFYLYVVDEEERLQGVISLRELLLAQPDVLLRELMNSRTVSVTTDADQETVADLARRYELLAIPVVDGHNILVGMVTLDDIFEVIQNETTEDMLRMAGTSEAEIFSDSSFKIAGVRLPWLFAAFVGGLFATQIIAHFEHLLTQVLALSAFLPVIMGMAGNIGVQSATVTVRGLATGTLTVQNTMAVLSKELKVGLILGIFYGAIIGVFSWLVFGNLDLAKIVSLTVVTNMTGAAILAILLPMFFHRIGTDPAIATGPFVTTAIDILGVANFFIIASLVLGVAP
ncbi:MAG: magnesium transporter [Rhodospirillales bacterium]|nr:magnesium transporter [Rhodospirillales bacterium]